MSEIEMLISVLNDDLKDAEMLFNYAKRAKSMKNEALCQMFIVRARERVSKFKQCIEYVRKEMKRTADSMWDTLGELMLQDSEERINTLDYNLTKMSK